MHGYKCAGRANLANNAITNRSIIQRFAVMKINCVDDIYTSLFDFGVEELGDGDFAVCGCGNVAVTGLDLLSDRTLTGLLADELLGFLEGVDEGVDSLVQLAQVGLHVFLLALRVLRLFIGVECFEVLLVVGGHSCGLAGHVLDGEAGRVVTHGLALLLLGLGRFGIQALLRHKSCTPLQGLALDVLSGLREQTAQLEEPLLADAHEEYVRDEVDRLALRLGLLLRECPEHQVRLELAQDLVVAEVGVLGQVQDGLGLIRADLVVVVVEHLNDALADEEHFLDVALVADHDLVLLEDPAEHVDDELVGEAALALVEEVVEGALELLEDPGILDEVRLHLGRDLLVEVELLDDQVEIVQEGLLDVLPDVVVECGLDVERLVRLLDLLDPHVERVQLLLDQVVEVIRSAEDARDRAHQEREEGQAQKLEQYGENVFRLRLPGVITIAYSGDDLEDPIESKDVYRCNVLLREV